MHKLMWVFYDNLQEHRSKHAIEPDDGSRENIMSLPAEAEVGLEFLVAAPVITPAACEQLRRQVATTRTHLLK